MTSCCSTKPGLFLRASHIPKGFISEVYQNLHMLEKTDIFLPKKGIISYRNYIWSNHWFSGSVHEYIWFRHSMKSFLVHRDAGILIIIPYYRSLYNQTSNLTRWPRMSGDWEKGKLIHLPSHASYGNIMQIKHIAYIQYTIYVKTHCKYCNMCDIWIDYTTHFMHWRATP